MDSERDSMWEEYFALARERAFPEETAGLDQTLVKRYRSEVNTIIKAELCAQEYSRSRNELHEQTTETGNEMKRLFLWSVLMIPMIFYVLGGQYYWFSRSVPYKLATGLCLSFVSACLPFPIVLLIIYIVRRWIYGSQGVIRETASIVTQIVLFVNIAIMLSRGETLFGNAMNWFIFYFAACSAEFFLCLIFQEITYRIRNRELIQRMQRLKETDSVVDSALEDAKKIAAFTDEKLRALNEKYGEKLTFPAPAPWFDYNNTDKIRTAFPHLPVDYNGNWHKEFIPLYGDEYFIGKHCEIIRDQIPRKEFESLLQYKTIEPFCGLGDPGGKKDRTYEAVYAKWEYEVRSTYTVDRTKTVYVDDEAYRQKYDREKRDEDIREFGMTMEEIARTAKDQDIRNAASIVNINRSMYRAKLEKPVEVVVGKDRKSAHVRNDMKKVLGAVLVYEGKKLVGLYYCDSQEAYQYVLELAEGLGMKNVIRKDLRTCLYNGYYEMSLLRKECV